MNAYNFTRRVRTVFQMARQEAARLQNEYVGTEHILLGLLAEGEGVAAALLTTLGVDFNQIRHQVESVVKKGPPGAYAGPELPYTSRAKKVIELGMVEARELDDSHVGTQHILLGLLREQKGIAAQVLVHCGVTLDRVTVALGKVPATDEAIGSTRAVPLQPRPMPRESFDLQLVRLRRPRLSDATAIFEYGNDPEVAHFADWPRRAAIEPLIESLHARAARWESGEEFYWVITLPSDDVAIGGISCRITRHAAEIGFLVARPHWGQGIATVAARAVSEWALSLAEVVRVWASCDAENEASVRVLEKIGMVREGKLRRWAVRPNISSEPRDAFIYAVVRPAAEA